jgi:hypothetical protein
MPLRSSTWPNSRVFAGLGAAVCLLALLGRAHAGDEIQVYDASIAEVGQWTIQHHFNYRAPRKIATYANLCESDL